MDISQNYGYHLTHTKAVPELLTGLDSLFYRISGAFKRRKYHRKRILTLAEEAVNIEHGELSENELRSKVVEQQKLFRRESEVEPDELVFALSILRESAFRTLGLRPYTVQIAGAIGLYYGYITEMGTGEGKTLTAALTAILRGWSGRPCHVITANDYLASRDGEKLRPLYEFCNITVGSVVSTSEQEERIKGYTCNVTYTTPKDVVADFLRDRIALGALQTYERRSVNNLWNTRPFEYPLCQRGIYYAIVDEADSVLIDEAVTPLIISQQQKDECFESVCKTAYLVADSLKCNIDYELEHSYREVEILREIDIHLLNKFGDVPRQFSGKRFLHEIIKQALMAKEFYHKDKHYVVADDKVQIVDEFTGRVMADRSWSAGLHQLIEAKERVPMTPPNETVARLSFQRFYRMYHHISGMTGTGKEAATELWHVYSMPVIPVPPNRPSKREVRTTKYFKTIDEKWDVIIADIQSVSSTGRPILVGTRSVDVSEMLAASLRKIGIRCEVINAVRHKEEASIISKAGERGAVTVATNMAGRGTDIEITDKVNAIGGLHVIATEPHESGRIDRQLFGRSARQGDNGSAQLYASLEDELITRYVYSWVRKIIVVFVGAKLPGAKMLASLTVTIAQKQAQKRAAQSRKMVQKNDTWLEDSLSFSQGDIS